MMTRIEKDIQGELLRKGLVQEEILNKAVIESERLKKSFYIYLIEQRFVKEEEMLSILSGIMSLPIINLKTTQIEDAAVKAVPIRFAWHYEFMPVRLEGRKLFIAMSNPLSIKVQDEIRVNLGYEISFALAKREEVLDLLKMHYGLGADTVDRMVGQAETGRKTEPAHAHHGIEDIEKLAGDASVVKLVNQILLDAYHKRATDIHIEPFRGRISLRYRIDGVLYEQSVPENFSSFLLPILSRIKVMCNLNIVERRVPQDGRAIVKTQEQILDLRVSFIPIPHGESVVIRILPTNMFLSLEKLGLAKKDIDLIKDLIEKPNGIIFVTGPTGSGKTTTLYACLKEMNSKEKKIITIEDPIECEMEGVTQIQVNPEVKLTFATGLRSMLRHDPDIMMVGEVRDKETAEISIRVALTGHLVLSTIHTNDAASGVTRLIDIGIEPYLVASTVEAFIAQRLVRRICPHCKVEDKTVSPELKSAIKASLSLVSEDAIKIYHGKGCDRCNLTGFHGRTAIYEILRIDKDIKKLIAEKCTASDIKLQAVKNGMRTLLQDGWAKVVQGVTTPEEVLEVSRDPELEAEEKEVMEKVALGNKERSEPQDDTKAKPKVPEPTLPVKEAEVRDGRENRIHARMPINIPVLFRLVEKASGDIIKLKKNAANVTNDNIFTKDIFEKKTVDDMSGKDFIESFTTTVNLSASGLVFGSQYLFPIGTILELQIDVEDGEGTIKTLAKVVRVEKNLPKCFYIAVCYLDISGANRARIGQIVDKEISQRETLHYESLG